jgi:hypothetical protein
MLLGQVSVKVACKEVMREVGGQSCSKRLSYECITIGYYN